ncbi:MAG: carboxypeptidase M32 [Desulfopila sp.]
MTSRYNHAAEKFVQIARIDHALTFLQWDQLVKMPPQGNEARARSLAELVSIRHQLLTEPELAELLQAAGCEELTPAQRVSLEEMERQQRQAICLPASLVKAQSLAGSTCEHGWRSQRKDNDWQGFLQNFVEVVRLSREEARLRQETDPERFATPYDGLLDLYCSGDTSAFIHEVFVELKAELPRLLQEVQDRQQPAPDLAGSYPLTAQKALSEKLMDCLGFDFSAGRLDVSMHPFSTGGRGDQRITTRFTESAFLEPLLSTAHETGHASYEAGLPVEWDDLPVGRARNMCIHESQSLLFEKQLVLSRPFLQFFTPVIHALLTDARQFDEEQIWQAAVTVRPGLIRTAADEVSYPLHVILRFEIESMLINGEVEPADIPELWDDRMQRYLGLRTVGNYRDGCLQDIHWTDGSFGYFPSYTIGALNAAQLFAAIRRAYPDWATRLAEGEIGFLRQWLYEKIWSKGSSMASQDLIREATGETTSPRHFLAHIEARYLNGSY